MPPRRCPLCQRGDLGRHRQSPACTWVRCPDCCVTFNAHTHTAYDRDWRTVTWPRVAS